MKKSFTVRHAALVATLTAATATAWAATVTLAPSTTIPTVVIEEHEIKRAEPLTTEDTLAPNESVVTAPEASTSASAPPRIERPLPVAERVIGEPPIVVEQKALTVDERIQADVMDRLAEAANLSGRIGVETNDAVVTLTGYTVTSGQAYRAERAARSVDGVRYVDNRIRARVGGSI
jgi:hypothetical protein